MGRLSDLWNTVMKPFSVRAAFVTIKPGENAGDPATFPQLEVPEGVVMHWVNTTGDPHQPWPLDDQGKLDETVQRGDDFYLSDPVPGRNPPPPGTQPPASPLMSWEVKFKDGKNEFRYCCRFHQQERGVIKKQGAS